MKAETRVTDRDELSEALDDATLGLIDGEEALIGPKNDRNTRDDGDLRTVVAEGLLGTVALRAPSPPPGPAPFRMLSSLR